MCNAIGFLQGALLGLSPSACSVHNVFTKNACINQLDYELEISITGLLTRAQPK